MSWQHAVCEDLAVQEGILGMHVRLSGVPPGYTPDLAESI